MQTLIRALLPTMLIGLTTACAHHVYSSKFDTKDWKAEGERVEGVIYYEPAYYKITHKFTERVDATGNVTTPCAQVIQKEEVALMADLKQPRVLLSDPGLLATGQLKVELSGGMLGGLETTTSSLLPALITSVVPIGALSPGTGPSNVTLPCNASPTIQSFTRYEPGSNAGQ